MAPAEGGSRNRPTDRVLDRSREDTLLAAARSGDGKARDELVRRHLPLVRAIASRFRDYGLPLDDLVQEGAIGLLQAIDLFDAARSPTFEPYARFRIRRAIRNALTEQGRLIRLPKVIVERRRALDRAETGLLAAGARPTLQDLGAATGLSLAEVVEARTATQAPVSFDEPLLPDGSALESVIADPAARDPLLVALDHERRTTLERALACLPDRHRRVVSARWGVGGARGTGLTELAGDLGLSPRRAQTIGREALYALRNTLESAGAAA